MVSLPALTLVPVHWPERSSAHGWRCERSFLDFAIDGLPLGPQLGKLVRVADVANDYASVLVTNWPAGPDTGAVFQLLSESPSPLADSRVPLYVCAECGGLGCGTITAAIEREPGIVTWHSLGRQTDYDPFVDLEPFAGIGPFRFHAADYDNLLRGVMDEMSRSRR